MDHNELRRQARDLAEQAAAIQAAADQEKRALSDEEATKIDALLADSEAKQKEADRRQRLATACSSTSEPVSDAAANAAAGSSEPSANASSRSGADANANADEPTRSPGRRTDTDRTDRTHAQARDNERERRGGFANFGEMAMAVYQAANPNFFGADRRLEPLAAASGMSQGVGTEGGFLVPSEFSQQIWDALREATDSLLPQTDQYTVTGESLEFNANAETSRAHGSRFGGIRGYWLEEAEQMTASKPKVRKLRLEPQQLGVFAYVTDKLLKNSAVALEQYLRRAATEEINFLVGDAIFEGSGAGQPLGILNSGALITVSKETGQAADTIVEANLVKMWARLHPRSRARAVWLVNQQVVEQLLTMSHTVLNGDGSAIAGGSYTRIVSEDGTRILGRPVQTIEYASALGDPGDIVLADMGMYATGTRGGVDSASSIHLRFDFNETAFRFLFEVDGKPWVYTPMTPFKGSDTLSPFVQLEARA